MATSARPRPRVDSVLPHSIPPARENSLREEKRGGASRAVSQLETRRRSQERKAPYDTGLGETRIVLPKFLADENTLRRWTKSCAAIGRAVRRRTVRPLPPAACRDPWMADRIIRRAAASTTPHSRMRRTFRRSRQVEHAVTEANAQVSGPQEVGIVPHTHWDREWYAPFQAYRVQLVHLVDDLLDLLGRTIPLRRFLLDGQTVVRRRLPRGPADRRGTAGPARRAPGACRSDRGPSSWTSSWCRARRWYATSSSASQCADPARRCDGRRLPPGHVRSRRADAADPAPRRPRRTRWCGAGCPPRSIAPRSGGRHPTVRACAPSISTARTRTDVSCLPIPAQLVARGAQLRARAGARGACPAVACC